MLDILRVDAIIICVEVIPMILDWNAYCYKIHTTHKLNRIDPSDNKSIFSQETHYVRFLELRKMSYRDIYYHWTKIKNGMAAAFQDDPEMQVATFGRIFKASANIPEKVFNQHYSPVKIYKSEIRFLNSIQAPVWVKQYWLVMLVYWKFVSQHKKNVELNTTLCNWAMRQTNVKDTFFGHHQDKIAEFNQHNGGHVMCTSLARRKHGGVIYWFDWAIEKSDEEFIEIKNLDKVQKATKLIVGNTMICPECGKKFIASDKQHTDLCPECYKKQRRNYINNKVRKLRESRKSSM